MGQIAIIGGGLAAVTAAESLRTGGYDGAVVLISDEEFAPYNKPPLSKQLLRGEVTTDETALRRTDWYAERSIDLMLGRRVTSLDVDAHRIQLADGTWIPYDTALLATGGRARELNVAGADLEGVHTLRTLDDVAALVPALTPDAPIVVVGAGFIGAEVAASARTLGCRVTLLEVAPVPLSRVLGPEVGQIYTDVHRSKGVDARCGVGLQEIRGDGRGHVTHVVDTDGTVHEAAAVVIGVGLVPNDEVAISSGIEVGNGVIVDEYCRTSAVDVYAAGDITYHPNPLLGRSFRVEQWQSAQHQGRDAARNMLGAQKPFSEIPWFWSDQYDLNLQMAGVPAGIDTRVFRGDVDGLNFSVFYLVGGVLEGVVGVNRVADVRIGRRLIAARATPDTDILGDESADLSELVASAAGV